MKTIVEYNLIKDDMDAIGELANWPWPNRIDPASKILPKVTTNYDMSERNNEFALHLFLLFSECSFSIFLYLLVIYPRIQ